MSRLWQLVVAEPLLSLAVVVVLLALLGWLLYRLVRRSETRGAVEPADLELCGEAPAEIIAFTSDPLRGEVRRSYARAESSLRRMLPGRARYARPWVLAVGPAAGGKTTLLSRSGMALPYGGPVPDSPGINWWAFDGGLVLDVAGSSCLQADACASDEEEWRGLLRKIRSSRRRRPVDALLLALPVIELMPSGRNDDQRLARAASRAGYLHRKLVEAQRVLGMRLPIYLVVSHCDRLPGFAALRDGLVAGERQQMIGWSNPQPPRSRYSPGLVDRAFEEIEAQLEEFHLELLAAGGGLVGRDELVELPERLRELAEPLRIFANHLFLPKADCEEPLFRGVYFCGGAPTAVEPGTELVPRGAAEVARPPGEVVFVGDLLQQKVFPEAALAEPTERASRRARRRALALGLLLAGLGAWAAAGLIVGRERLAQRLDPAGAPADAGLTAFLDRYGDGAEPGASPEASRDLLRQASRVGDFRVWSPWLPASWFAGLQGEVDGALDGSLERVVLPTLLAELERRSAALLAEPLPELDPRTVAIEPVESYPQLRELESYVGRLSGLARLVDRYQAFTPAGSGRRPSLREFNVLALELLGDELRPGSRRAERYLRRRLAGLEAQPFDYAGRRQPASAAILARTDQLYKALFVHHRLLQDLEAVSVSLASLGPMQWTTEADERTFQELYRGLERVSRDLEEPDLAWASAEELELGPRFEAIRRQVHESRFLGAELGPRVSEEMRRRAQEMFSRLKKALLVFGTSYGGPLLDRREGQYVLTDSAGDLTAALGLIVGELFMQPQAGGELVAQAPPGKMLLWRKQPLEEALAVFDSFESFPGNVQQFLDERQLDDLPPPLRQSVPQIAAAAAGSHLIGLVANAISFEPLPPGLSLEEAVEMQVRNLQEVEPIHASILAALTAMDRTADGLRVGGILRRYQVGILRQLDEILAANPLYQPRFATWQGEGTPVVPAFVETVDDIGGYLDAQREIAERLTLAYARPVLAAYGAAGHRRLLASSATARWWMRMVGAFDAYASAEAGNPIGTLESFVATTLPEVDLYSCFGPLPPPVDDAGEPAAGAAAPPARPQGDFFLGRLAALRRELRGRCVELADEVGFGRYRALAAEFNRLLAGRFPFAPAAAEPEADPADLKSLLGDEFGRTLILIRNLPDESRRQRHTRRWQFGDSTAEVQRFMELLEVVRAFFAAYLPEDAELEVPTFDLEVEFRTLRSKELGANQIIRWELEIGDEQRLDLLASLRAARTPPEPEAEPPARWSYGLATVLSVAWAQESPFAPLTVEPSRRAEIEGREVTFTYREPWSLLRLVAELEADTGELPDLTEPRPEVLGIAVRTASADEPHPVGLAKLFLTLSLLSPGGDVPLAYPDFPHRAPVSQVPPAAAPSP